MQQIGRFILILVLMTAFADLVPTVQDFFEPHTKTASDTMNDSVNDVMTDVMNEMVTHMVTDPSQCSDHHHDGPCVGGHCHLGHCAFLSVSAPTLRLAKTQIQYQNQESQLPVSPILDTKKRPPRA